ncbi:HD domain-containing phosphohydrolase [Halanaerobium saccharolyticum]|uniref:HD-GYP domain-containing protein n=1 Tax=Halanaerobium saccharolyticum TaxID=43595 RepID=UPI003FCC5D94
MKSRVFVRAKNKFKEIEITDINKPVISEKFLNKWQNILNLITDLVNISAALIMKINSESIEVFLKSENKSNPYEIGEEVELGEGLYCETVLGENKELYIENALKNKIWENNPDVELEMISYYGLPINWPDKKSFGTICILDNENIKLRKKDKKLLQEFKNIVEEDLELLINQVELVDQKRLFENLFDESLEGILLMDQDYNVLKVNSKFEEVFGYSEAELLDNNLENFIIPESEKENFYKYKNQVLANNKVETEVRRKTKEGTIKYFSLHVIKVELMAGKLGIYAVYDDITEQRKQKEKIKYLSYKDSLTNLYNRRFFEEEMKRLDTKRQLPISIIMADVNGLKIINDSFGHQKGDQLLVKTAKILKSTIRDEDILARQGGDEFAIILPKTDRKSAQQIINRINRKCEKTEADELRVSIALGTATKTEEIEDIEEILKQADNDMYQNKLSESRSTKSKIVKGLVDTLNEKSNETKEHSERMSNLAKDFGRFLGLNNSQLHRLSLLGTLHDIGMITIPESILNKPDKLKAAEWKIVKKHPETGYQIASASEEFTIIAEDILAHHERWDGSGYPRKLKQEKIPYLARIITIIDAYDVMTHDTPYKKAVSSEEALQEIEKCAGGQFDPELAEKFIEMMRR